MFEALSKGKCLLPKGENSGVCSIGEFQVSFSRSFRYFLNAETIGEAVATTACKGIQVLFQRHSCSCRKKS